jgi:SAM-dependent methyltransferase
MDTSPSSPGPEDPTQSGTASTGIGSAAVLGEHAAVNLAQWDERAPAHAASPDYHLDDFVCDPDYISDVVRFDLPRLGDVRGLRGVHLQCHIGTDTISLARLGAGMTGLDFSAAAITAARALAERCETPAQFVVSDVHDAADVLGRGAYDLVFTGIGALCWIPDIRRWAGVVADLLAPGGRLFLREGHPMLWSLADPDVTGTLRVEHPYFEQAEPTRWDEGGTYVQTDVEFAHNVSYEWNHGLGEIVTALLDHGLRVTGLVEHDSIPWDGLPGLMGPVGGGEMRLLDRPERLAASYTLQATRPR